MGIKLSRDLYNQAKEKGITLSQLLENMEPSDGKSNLSAFERQLKEHRIATKSSPTKGYSADKVKLTEQMSLKFCSRVCCNTIGKQ